MAYALHTIWYLSFFHIFVDENWEVYAKELDLKQISVHFCSKLCIKHNAVYHIWKIIIIIVSHYSVYTDEKNKKPNNISVEYILMQNVIFIRNINLSGFSRNINIAIAK